MAGLARKIVVCAAIDGLIIQPLTSRGQRPFSPVQIRYGDSVISDVSRDHIPDISQDEDSFEAFGVIGLVTVSKISFLITITRRQQVAQIFGHPIYAVTGVAITPCSSKDRATKSIRKTSRQLESQPPSADGEQTESSDDEVEMHGLPDEVDDAVVDVPSPERSARNSIAEDVFRRRGSYGKFAQRWFSRDDWSTGKKSAMGIPEASAAPPTDTTSVVDTRKIPEANEVVTTSLLPKLIQAMYVLFGSSKSFYYSYDIDITRSIMGTPLKDNVEKPLYTAVEEDFFWNRSVLAPFIEARQEALALPIIQGFVGQKSFTVDSSPPQVDEPAVESMEMRTLSPARDPESEKAPPNASERRESERTYLLTLISRRSTQRPGLRYMRRGINENGYTANTVETEQILSGENWDSKRPIQSFVQMRGSIPLFWSQTPYALKPIPVVQHSPEENYRACKMHFQRIIDRYGQIQVVNLVEKHGIEAPLGNLFEQNVDTLTKELGDSKLSFEWFDFHHACRGMKFENVSDLLLRVKDRLEALGSTVQTDGKASQTQSGVFRTNCMDCLDRTNVCQSSFAKHMLEYQLKEDGIDMSAQIDQQTMWFNELWADNGDAVSNQYASTAAMKGDYTRTRKRDYRGALNDLGLSLTRLYNGMVNDHFSQAVIDFLLGNVTGKVFDEFEADMMTKDPAVSLVKMRERAIELCQKRVIADLTEEVHGGWVLISPDSADTLKSVVMQEVVLVLTDAALYLCRFDWDLDKVSSFERVNLGKITSLKFGTYITSTISPSHTDEERNVGFVVTYEPSKTDVVRTNTRTLSSNGDLITPTATPTPTEAPPKSDKRSSALFTSLFTTRESPTSRSFAFKAPYIDSSTAAKSSVPTQTEIQQVVTICADIERLVFQAQRKPEQDGNTTIIEKGDIISLDAAKRNTTLFEQLGHSLKRLVWA